MEKTREIPPNAATKQEVQKVTERISRLGLDFHAAAQKAGLSHATGYRLLRGTASVAALRRLDEWLRRQELNKGMRTPNDDEKQIDMWNQLGADLMRLDPEDFTRTLDGLRDLVEAKKLQSAAIRKMFRANPEE